MSPKKSSVEERRRTMDLTRRELERMVLAGLSTPLFSRPSTAAPAKPNSKVKGVQIPPDRRPLDRWPLDAKPNSKVKGVQIGVQSYSFRDRGLDEAIQAMLDVGLSSCEMYSGHVEPKGSGPGGPQAREVRQGRDRAVRLQPELPGRFYRCGDGPGIRDGQGARSRHHHRLIHRQR